jgi:putative ABC transport system permease protein
MTLIELGYVDLFIASLLIFALAGVSWWQKLALGKTLLISALRAFVQLSLVGFVLMFLFATESPYWLLLWATFMLLVAGKEVNDRQKYRLKGVYGFALSATAMFFSSFLLSAVALTLVISPSPWYQPQYAIPLLGMMLGNTMNGIAISLDRLSQGVLDQSEVIDQRLLLGERWFEAVRDIRREAARSGMIPMINGMATAGLVSLPGMMTGQILAGSSPQDAVKYQIMIFFLITAGTGFGVLTATWVSTRRLFDDRERFIPERLLDTQSGS